MLAAICCLFAALFAEAKPLNLQIHLDRAGYSCSAIDGVWGEKSNIALRAYLLDRQLLKANQATPSPEDVFKKLFSQLPPPFRYVEVTEADRAALVKIPDEPAERANLGRMGYESLQEMFAERGHLSQIALAKLNPKANWPNPPTGTRLLLPDFPPVTDEFRAAETWRRQRPERPVAALVRISLSGTIRALDENGKTLLVLPCSIAADKRKIPPQGELKITDCIAWPNYTYTPDRVEAGKKVRRYVWPSGENCPVGIAWLGLNLPGYGIHGTPRPESIGFTGSHGCFRLANWNAARLYAICRSGTKVIIEP